MIVEDMIVEDMIVARLHHARLESACIVLLKIQGARVWRQPFDWVFFTLFLSVVGNKLDCVHVMTMMEIHVLIIPDTVRIIQVSSLVLFILGTHTSKYRLVG